MKLLRVLVIGTSLGVLFFLGRIAGGVFFAEDVGPAGMSSKSQRRSSTQAAAIDRHGVSMFVARRDGFSETAQELIALYRSNNFGGSAFLEALMDLDSEELDRLVHELMAHELTPKLNGLAHLVFQRWAEVDPKARLKVLLGPESEGWKKRYYFTTYALEALARTDPKEALAIASSMEEGGRRALYIENIFRIFIRRDPAAAAQAIRDYELSAIAPHAQAQVMVQLMLAWGSSDPQAAAAFVGGLPPTKARGTALAYLAAEWGKSDPVAAMRWLQGLEESNPNVVSYAIAKLVENAIEHQPEFVREFINTAENGALAGATLAKLAKHYTEADAESALAWLKLMDDYDMLSSAGQGIIAGLSPGDTLGFAEVSSAAPVGARPLLMNAFVDRWANHQPLEAIEWAKSLERRERRAATEGVMNVLIDSEGGSHHVELAELLDSDPNLRRSFSPYLSESWAQEDGAAAFAWADRVEWQDQRLKALREVMTYWGRRDATAARAALEAASNLSPEERQLLSDRLPTP